MKRLDTRAISRPSQTASFWQIPLRLTLDALSDMYYGTDGPWVDELRAASLNELKFEDGDLTSRAAVEDFFTTYRRQLHPRRPA